MDDFFTGHGCKSGCHFFPSCSEVNSKGYLEFDEPISARLERYPLFSILTSDIASLKVFTEYPCFQVKIYIIEMFVTVPPVGRCTKQLTSSRWILFRARGADFQVGGLTRTRKRELTRGVRGHAPPGKFEILFF